MLLVGRGMGDRLLGLNVGFLDDTSVGAAVGWKVGTRVGPCVGKELGWPLTTPDGSIVGVGLTIDGRDVLVGTIVGGFTSRLTNRAPPSPPSPVHNPSTSVMLQAFRSIQSTLVLILE